jgi:hypothetical protein
MRIQLDAAFIPIYPILSFKYILKPSDIFFKPNIVLKNDVENKYLTKHSEYLNFAQN